MGKDQEKVEERWQKSRKRFKNLFEAIPDPAFLMGRDGTFQKVNEAFSQTTGYDREEVVGLSLANDLSFLSEEARQKLLENFKKRLKGEDISPYSLEAQAKDGRKIRVEINARLLKSDDDIIGVIVVARDVTERKEAKSNFQKYFEESGDAIFITKLGEEDMGKIFEANPAAMEQTGYSKEELIAMKIGEDLSVEGTASTDFSGASSTKLGKIDERLLRGETLKFVEKKRRKDGTQYWTEVMVAPIEYEGERASLSINRDVTKRKKLEEREDFLHSLLRHDVKNKTQVVQGYLELLEDTDLSEEQKKLVERAKRGSKGGIDIIEKVRTLRKISEKQDIGEIDIGQVLDQAVVDNETRASKGIEIKLEDVHSSVRGRTLMKELFSNLIENAIVHADCENIRISSRETGDECIITIEDDGIGIPKENKEKVFERGFKSEETGGSGLGMFLVKEIAETYGGGLEVKDSEMGGARFDVHLKKA